MHERSRVLAGPGSALREAGLGVHHASRALHSRAGAHRSLHLCRIPGAKFSLCWQSRSLARGLHTMSEVVFISLFPAQKTFSFLFVLLSLSLASHLSLLVRHSSPPSRQNNPRVLPDVGNLKAVLAHREFSLRNHQLCPEQQVSLLQQKTLRAPGQPTDIFTPRRKGPTGDTDSAKGTPK